MCRALKVLCAASSPERLDELKRAAVSAHLELAGGATSARELAEQVELHGPDVVVLDESLGGEAVGTVRAARPTARIVGVGSVAGADVEAAAVEDIRDCILGVRRTGGPVGG